LLHTLVVEAAVQIAGQVKQLRLLVGSAAVVMAHILVLRQQQGLQIQAVVEVAELLVVRLRLVAQE
jgi:hypothetical protein